tara:strand:+ start:242 stop:445 length:204 start_codon:yes stop_codon:yes gene_type:complete
MLWVDLMGWIGALMMVIAPPFIDTDLGKALSIIGLSLLTFQAIDKRLYNLVLLNTAASMGYLYALYF